MATSVIRNKSIDDSIRVSFGIKAEVESFTSRLKDCKSLNIKTVRSLTLSLVLVVVPKLSSTAD